MDLIEYNRILEKKKYYEIVKKKHHDELKKSSSDEIIDWVENNLDFSSSIEL